MAEDNFTQLQSVAAATAHSSALAREFVVKLNDHLQIAEYEGTQQQLIDEGVIPKGFVWPERNHPSTWRNDHLTFSVQRTRPEGLKGPMKAWIEGDWWCLRIRPSKLLNAYQIDVRQKEHELQVAIYRESYEGHKACNALWENFRKARRDSQLQTFLDDMWRPTGRPLKSRGLAL